MLSQSVEIWRKRLAELYHALKNKTSLLPGQEDSRFLLAKGRFKTFTRCESVGN